MAQPQHPAACFFASVLILCSGLVALVILASNPVVLALVLIAAATAFLVSLVRQLRNRP